MPIWLRRFTYQEIIEIRTAQNEAEKEAYNKAKKGNKGTSIDLANPNKSKIPNRSFSPPTTKSKAPPTYKARASKK